VGKNSFVSGDLTKLFSLDLFAGSTLRNWILTAYGLVLVAKPKRLAKA